MRRRVLTVSAGGHSPVDKYVDTNASDAHATPFHTCVTVSRRHRWTHFYADNARKLEQQELEATYTDAWAVGGSEESDCVCRGGRCPRMWDCPFWVDIRRAEAKGSSAHVSIRQGMARTSRKTGRGAHRRKYPRKLRCYPLTDRLPTLIYE